MRHSTDGLQVWRAVVESTLPAALQQLVFAHGRRTPPAPAEWGVRLRMDAGEAMALRVGRSLQCEALPREWQHRSRTESPFDVRVGRSEEFGWVHVRVDHDGNVTAAEVVRLPARSFRGQHLQTYARTITFWPAVIDDQPIASELTFPVPLSQVP